MSNPDPIPHVFGIPEPDSPFRCRTIKKDGDRCKLWALKGVHYCKFHGGKQAQRKGRPDLKHLPMFYKKHLSQTLQDALEQALAISPHEQLNLFEELALVRMTACDAVTLWNASQQQSNAEIRTNAAMIMRDSLKDVISTCESAARVSISLRDKITVHDVAFTVASIVRIAYEVFADDLPRAKQFESLIRDHVQISDASEGTNLTPDRDAHEMDDTVPKA